MWIVPILLKIAIVLSAILFYVVGESKEALGFSDKSFKYFMGFIPAICGTALSGFSNFTLLPMTCFLTYLIACELGYGSKNPMTLIVGKRAAITIHGTAVGLAAYPLIGLWCLLGGAISGTGFFIIAKRDDEGRIIEPFIAIGRGIVAMAMVAIIYLITIIMKMF